VKEIMEVDNHNDSSNDDNNVEMTDADNNGQSNDNNGTIEEGGVKLRFRSYRPKDAGLKKGVLPKPVAPNIEADIDSKLKTLVSTPDDQVSAHLINYQTASLCYLDSQI